jgi:hypothetical protein
MHAAKRNGHAERGFGMSNAGAQALGGDGDVIELQQDSPLQTVPAAQGDTHNNLFPKNPRFSCAE